MYYSINRPDEPWENWLQKYFFPLLLLGIIANGIGLFITIIEPDGALYATIAKTMAQTNDFIRLKVEGKDWLDKPHFPFWITAFSYKIFGITTFAYKFPALLFWLMGGWYTYRFAISVYNRSVAQLAVLIYVTAAHLVISNNDVRAEPYLTGLIIGAVYHFYRAANKGRFLHIVIGALLAACAAMTKGPFVVLIIGGGLVMHWLVTKDYKQLFHYRWWLAIILTAIFILPELYCLYVQFDLHPEKIVFGRTHVSGIRFFFWDSQFGRFFNTGPIKGSGDPFFYFHTVLWAFLPWSLLLYAAIIWSIKKFKDRAIANPEYITLFTIIITFLLFSLSRFQLPHYLNIIFPFFAIITARYIYAISSLRTIRWIRNIQLPLCILLLVSLIPLIFIIRFTNNLFLITLLYCPAIFLFYVFRRQSLPGTFGRTTATGILLYFFLNIFFYPSLLHYQSGSQAAFHINKLQLPANVPVVMYGPSSYSFAFYLDRPLHYWGIEEIKLHATKGPVWVFVKKDDLGWLLADDLKWKIVNFFPAFHISQLTGKFINYKTREEVLEEYVLAVAVYKREQK